MPEGQNELEQIAGGDKQAFERLFKNHFRDLCLYASYRTHDPEAAREIVQDLFCTIWEKRTELRIHTSVTSYLYRSVHNAALNFLKHEKVKDRSHQYLAEHSIPESYEAEEEIRAMELSTALAGALESLPEKTREIFEMVRFKDLKYREVAEKLNISQKTVEAHMTNALKLLKISLRNYLPV